MDYKITRAYKIKQDETLVGISVICTLTNQGNIRSNVGFTLDGDEFQNETAKPGTTKENIWDWYMGKLAEYKAAWNTELTTQMVEVEEVEDILGGMGSPTGTV